MIASRFHKRLFVLLASYGAGALLAYAQPQAVAAPPAEPRDTPPRPRPQVIYHLPPASPYAAALHSQAKTQREALPIDGNMPTSLQMSRAAANEGAAKSRAESVAPQRRPSQASRPAPKVREIKRRSVGPGHSPGKAKGPGHSQGKKSHRK